MRAPSAKSSAPNLQAETRARLLGIIRELNLPAVQRGYGEIASRMAKEGQTYEGFLLEVLEREVESRRHNRFQRLLRESKLPQEKTAESFDWKRLPVSILQQAKVLMEGLFVERKENVLCFGNPGSGKTHLLCAIAHAQLQKGRAVYFSTTGLLVQELLQAKRDLRLKAALKRLNRFQVLMLDDIGYVQQDREEMEVLFTLLAERYERGSVMITSNLPFSKWEQIFKDPMTTAAAVDRLVHHCVIVELNMQSYRMQEAKRRKDASADLGTETQSVA